MTDSSNRERVSLQLEEDGILLGLWGEESGNPGPAHVNVINQVAVVGFEMVIFSFSRVFVLENTNPDYVADILLYVNYALE